MNFFSLVPGSPVQFQEAHCSLCWEWGWGAGKLRNFQSCCNSKETRAHLKISKGRMRCVQACSLSLPSVHQFCLPCPPRPPPFFLVTSVSLPGLSGHSAFPFLLRQPREPQSLSLKVSHSIRCAAVQGSRLQSPPVQPARAAGPTGGATDSSEVHAHLLTQDPAQCLQGRPGGRETPT